MTPAVPLGLEIEGFAVSCGIRLFAGRLDAGTCDPPDGAEAGLDLPRARVSVVGVPIGWRTLLAPVAAAAPATSTVCTGSLEPATFILSDERS